MTATVVSLDAYRRARAKTDSESRAITVSAEDGDVMIALGDDLGGGCLKLQPDHADLLAARLRAAAREATRRPEDDTPVPLIRMMGLDSAVARLAASAGVAVDDVLRPERDDDTAALARPRAEVWALLHVARAVSYREIARRWQSTPARVRSSIRRLARGIP